MTASEGKRAPQTGADHERGGGDAVDRDSLRAALGSFATGIAVVTSVDDGGTPVGLTVNSFSSVSMTPPLVLFCLDRGAFSLPTFLQAEHFAVNILEREQAGLSRLFARPLADKWAGLRWTAGAGGVPLLPGCVAWLECGRHAVHEGGDHLILIGEVLRARSEPGREALLYKRGRYGRFLGG